MDQKSVVGIRDAQIINEDLYLFSGAGNVVRNIELVESSKHLLWCNSLLINFMISLTSVHVPNLTKK